MCLVGNNKGMGHLKGGDIILLEQKISCSNSMNVSIGRLPFQIVY